MGGWYKLDADDARHLAQIAGTFTDPRSSEKRHRMLLYCYSQIQSRAKPCPSFKTGIRTIAKDCDVSFSTARRFLESMEGQGWVVRVGSGKDSRGSFERRTFWWIAEDGGCAQSCAHPVSTSKEVCAQGCAQSPLRKDTHQSTEYSENASRSSAGAEALASDNMSEALLWYTERGLTPPTPYVSEDG